MMLNMREPPNPNRVWVSSEKTMHFLRNMCHCRRKSDTNENQVWSKSRKSPWGRETRNMHQTLKQKRAKQHLRPGSMMCNKKIWMQPTSASIIIIEMTQTAVSTVQTLWKIRMLGHEVLWKRCSCTRWCVLWKMKLILSHDIIWVPTDLSFWDLYYPSFSTENFHFH